MKTNKTLMQFIKYIPVVLLFIFVIFLIVFAVRDIGANTDSEGLVITERAVKRAVITCYSQEGSYPESIEYLKENYGLHISDEYDVFYSMFATNIMPDIRITRKQVNN